MKLAKDKNGVLTALTGALVLAVTAPSDAKADEAIELADYFAAKAIEKGATAHDIELCKKAAHCVLEYYRQKGTQL